MTKRTFAAFCYNCTYTVICAVFCAMAFDTYSLGGGDSHPYLIKISFTQAVLQGTACTLCGTALLFFLWRNWWRDAKRI